MEQPDERSSSW